MSSYESLKNNTLFTKSVWFGGCFGFFLWGLHKKHMFLVFRCMICDLKKLYL
jgi:hypothetical protein